ncbi:MAG TPA: ribonuclease P [Candidatus Thermoplasmatota archaeon]
MARRNKSEERMLAQERMRHLVALAEKAQRGKEATSEIKRYVSLARRIGMRYQVSLPQEMRRRICRGCESVLISGNTARHRVTSGRLTVTCLLCGAVKRYPFKPTRNVMQ